MYNPFKRIRLVASLYKENRRLKRENQRQKEELGLLRTKLEIIKLKKRMRAAGATSVKELVEMEMEKALKDIFWP